MKPLSATKYFWENKRKTLLVLAVFLLTIIAISFTASLVNSAFVSAETVTLGAFNNIENIGGIRIGKGLDRVADHNSAKCLVKSWGS